MGVFCILATYMLTRIITLEDGPFGFFYALRQEFEFPRCFNCVSVWVAALIALAPSDNFQGWFIYSLAFAGGAVLINSFIERQLDGKQG